MFSDLSFSKGWVFFPAGSMCRIFDGQIGCDNLKLSQPGG